MRISVLIPAYNEEDNIQATLKGLGSFRETYCKEKGLDLDILVIDDGSSDKTYEKALRSGAEAIKLEKNTGKGGALRAGIGKAQGDIVVFLDADLRESSEEVYKLVEPILSGDADVTIARFERVSGKGFGLVKALAYYGIKLFTGKSFSSGLSGQRAFKRSVLESVKTIPDGFGIEVGMLIDILRKGFNVKEVKVSMTHDVTGRNLKGFLHRGTQFRDILKLLLSRLGRGKTVD
jgi:glycosyltransferase involved in cell wall biosynthesis